MGYTYISNKSMLLDNDEKKQNIWFMGFLCGTIIGIFAGIAIIHLIFI
jgi:hypothetical protein